MNVTLLAQAQQDWESFINSLSEDERKGLIELSEPINSNGIHSFAAFGDTVRFDQAFNQLSDRYKFDSEIILTAYNFYVQRELHEIAYDYIQAAQEFFIKNGNPIPADIQNVLSNSESVKLLNKYKISLDRIRGLLPKNIPSITPDTINDKRQLNMFILNEIIQAVRVVREKIEALRQVTHENRFNDFIEGILRLRFPIWGWTISDQGRMGTATGGADAGSSDFLIQSGGNNFALIEAFILRDTKYTQTHILKCPRYIGTIKRYYIVVYCFDIPINLEIHWNNYKTDVLSAAYPADFLVDVTTGFVDLIHEFDDVNLFKIAKTIHHSDIEMFHVMINLGPRLMPVIRKKAPKVKKKSQLK